MITIETTNTLGRLLTLHRYSLPVYLQDAEPWIEKKNEKAVEALALVAADQLDTVDRIGELLIEHGATVAPGGFPLTYTALHDLSFDYLLQRAIDEQRKLIDSIKACSDDLRLAPAIQAIAQEAWGQAKGHLESLEELQHPAEADS
jgi:hypothetical protein